MPDSNVLIMMEDKKKLSWYCSACNIGKRCLKVDNKEEDVQLLVSLRRYHYIFNRDQESIDGKAGGSEAVILIAIRSWAHQTPVLQAPLPLQGVGPDREPAYVKVPFSTADLMHWKESSGSHQENLEKMY